MKTLNLGILAHIDAGKTSLTERILYDVGAVGALGSVDRGTTVTDSMDLERQRGITIQSAVTAFTLADTQVNLVDTPGHPDFIAEIERVLDILDGAVLVVSAVEGVQAQTRVLYRALKRCGIPFIIYVNKIDRQGARYETLLDEISTRLTEAVVPLGSVQNIGTALASFELFNQLPEPVAESAAAILADLDEQFMERYLESEGSVPEQDVRRTLLDQSHLGAVHPVVFGSAITGAGTKEVLQTIAGFLPSIEPEVDAPQQGTVFKIERAPTGEKVCYVRMFKGSMRARERVSLGDKEQRIGALQVFRNGGSVPSNTVEAGQIAKVWGLPLARIGDTIGEMMAPQIAHFSPPLLETAVSPRDPKDRGRLFTALAELAEQDPLIGLGQDDEAGLLFVKMYGEVQKEVIADTLTSGFGIDVEFSESSVVHIERVVGTGTSFEAAPDPFIATIGIRVEPGEPGAGIVFDLELDIGSLPAAFYRAVEEAAMNTLQQGLYGWQVTDCVVTMTDGIRHRDWANATAADHRKLAPLVVMDALRKAGTIVCEPIQKFYLECPADCVGALMTTMVVLRALPADPVQRGGICIIEGTVPAARFNDLQLAIPGLTRGEGFVEATFSHHDQVIGENPVRARTGLNPLNRADYLRQLVGRVNKGPVGR